MDPEEMARAFAEAAEDVASKVGHALEQAFEHTAEQVDRHVGPDVGERVASAIGHVVEKVGEAIPRPDPGKVQREQDRRLLRRRDANLTSSAVSTLIAVGVAVAVVTGLGLEALPIAIVVAVLFGGRITSKLLWNRRHTDDFRRAEQRLQGRDPDRDSDDDSIDDDEAFDTDTVEAIQVDDLGEVEPVEPNVLLESSQTLDLTQAGVVDMEGRQILTLLTEMGEERPAIRESVESTVAKARELGQRRRKLQTILSDPDLSSLDRRIEGLAERIAATEDAETRRVYERTADQLRAQSESLADIEVMQERIDAYLEASLQALRTMHIDLLRLQTGDLDDPDRVLGEVTSRADNLSLEIKGVREVVEEVQGARRNAGRKPVRTM